MKIVGTGLNYRSHILEQGREPPAEPLLFGKFASTVIGPGIPIVLPREAEHVDSEAELAVEIGRSGRRIGEDDALDFVAGYRCANDVTARNLQRSDRQWTRAKGFDTFCPLGDRLAPVSALGDGAGLRIVQRLNGELLQEGNTSDLVFGVRRLVSFVSAFMTLEPGDLILTGTPPGLGHTQTPPLPMRPGDEVEIEIEGIGVLRNPVASEPALETARGRQPSAGASPSQSALP